MSLLKYIQDIEGKFSESSVRIEEAKELVAHVLGIPAAKLFLEEIKGLTPEQHQTIQSLVEKRVNGEPLQYLVGECGFWKSVFKVGPGVLIPRPETEHLLEVLLENKQENLKVAELGAGSGNIGISALQERNWEWHAFEINPDSLPFVRENCANLLPPHSNYHLHAEDFFVGVEQFAPYDGIVSNPPYVETAEIEKLAIEVRKEPVLALDGGPTGLELIAKLVQTSFSLLKQGGFFATEIGFGQEEEVRAILSESGFSDIRITKDLAGIERIVEGKKPWMH